MHLASDLYFSDDMTFPVECLSNDGCQTPSLYIRVYRASCVFV